MVAGKSERAIRAAVDECLAGCYSSDHPLTHLVQYIQSLRQDGWSESDIRAVEQIARRVLAQVMSSSQELSEAS
jgi:hypothetical protein